MTKQWCALPFIELSITKRHLISTKYLKDAGYFCGPVTYTAAIPPTSVQSHPAFALLSKPLK